MKKYLIFITLLFVTVCANAQTKDTTGRGSNTDIVTKVDQTPQYPGGITEFYKFLTSTLRYPAAAREKNIQGKVFVVFVVEKDGALSNVKILRGLSDDIDAEAIRVLQLSPKWKPGMKDGQIVRTYYTVPIAFSLTKQ